MKKVNKFDEEKKLYDHDLENAVLGAMLIESDSIARIIEVFKPVAFDKKENKIIAKAILDLYATSKPIDILTVTQLIHKDGNLEEAGGAYYVSSLTDRIASSANIEYHYRLIQQYYLERFLLDITNETKKKIYTYGNDIFDVLNWVQSTLEGGINNLSHKKARAMRDIHEELLVTATKINESGVKSGVTTGYRLVDNTTSGWQKSDFIIYAGRASMGKTAGVLNFAYNAAVKNRIPVGLFSLEMSDLQFGGRLQAIHTGINAGKIIKNQHTKDEINFIHGNGEDLASAPIYIDDTPAISLLEVRAKARKMVKDDKVELIIIDYLQLMTSGMNIPNREQEISTISRGLKQLARELEVPIIALSQLSRAVETRGGDKKPQLSDLRESGSLEQDADQVIFAYRPSYYGITEYELNGNIVNSDGLYLMIFAKNRNGALGEIPLLFTEEQMKLDNWDLGFGNKITHQNNDVANQQHTTNFKNNLQNKETVSTFVQEQAKLTDNTDFLSQGKKEDEAF